MLEINDVVLYCIVLYRIVLYRIVVYTLGGQQSWMTIGLIAAAVLIVVIG